MASVFAHAVAAPPCLGAVVVYCAGSPEPHGTQLILAMPGSDWRCIASAPRARQYGPMSKKRNRAKRQKAGGAAAGEAPRSKKKRRVSGASLAFIGLILLAAVAIAIASVFSDRPDCPPGQVWSESHGHCH